MNGMKSWLFRTVVTLLVFPFAIAASAGLVFAAADAYPIKAIRLIVPMSAGGSGDLIARLIAGKLSERLGKQVVVENHGGAGGIIGTEMVSKADPDGYMLLYISGAHTIQPALQENLPYDPVKSFTPIAKVASSANVLTVHPSVPANSVEELIALAKKKPGQLIFVAGGVGSPNHMATELFKMMADIDFKILQFKGGGPGLVDLLGGHSHAEIGSLLPRLPHIKAGKLRALGTSGAKRSIVLPDMPTIAEAGVPGFTAASWGGFVAPAGTPAPIVDRLSSEIKGILTADDVKKLFLKDGGEVDYLAQSEFGVFMARETNNWARVVKKANIMMEK